MDPESFRNAARWVILLVRELILAGHPRYAHLKSKEWDTFETIEQKCLWLVNLTMQPSSIFGMSYEARIKDPRFSRKCSTCQLSGTLAFSVGATPEEAFERLVFQLQCGLKEAEKYRGSSR